jgi:hypothetical protein
VKDAHAACNAKEEQLQQERKLVRQCDGRYTDLPQLADEKHVHRIECAEHERLRSNRQRDLEHDRIELAVTEQRFD